MKVGDIPFIYPDLARIVIGYVEVLKHPIEIGRCAECRVEITDSYDMCKLHEKRCVVCLESKSDTDRWICGSCMEALGGWRWWEILVKITDRHVFATFYAEDEYPIDLEYLCDRMRVPDSIMMRYHGKTSNSFKLPIGTDWNIGSEIYSAAKAEMEEKINKIKPYHIIRKMAK